MKTILTRVDRLCYAGGMKKLALLVLISLFVVIPLIAQDAAFYNDRGVEYLQLTHRLYNPNSFPVSGQKFGASADVMINKNDGASLIHTPFGVRMTDSENNPSVELLFICERGNGITPVDTLWLGTYDNGRHLDYIYADRRADVHGEDSAVGFSYQNIDLASGEAKEFVVRFNLAGNED